MKKIMLSLAMALVSVCASAQVYIGGTAGISSNKIGDGDSKTAYTLMPEIGYSSYSKGGGDAYEAGIKPGLAVKLSDHVNFITKVGFLGYKGYSPDHGDNSSTFGLNVDASNISFGAIYKF